MSETDPIVEPRWTPEAFLSSFFKLDPYFYWAVGDIIGGRCEIRTHGTLRFGGFQDRWFKPLTQPSTSVKSMLSRVFEILKCTSGVQVD